MRARWEWEGAWGAGHHLRGCDEAESREALKARLSARSITLVYAFQLPAGHVRLPLRVLSNIALLAATIAAGALCPWWAASWIIGTLAAMAVARAVPPRIAV